MEKLCNSDFERAVLGGMIKYKGIIEEYREKLDLLYQLKSINQQEGK